MECLINVYQKVLLIKSNSNPNQRVGFGFGINNTKIQMVFIYEILEV